jgi:hypothetical protein
VERVADCYFEYCGPEQSPARDGALQALLVVGRGGIEPPTLGLKAPVQGSGVFWYC